jgi:hydroxymethylbilane synthase
LRSFWRTAANLVLPSPARFCIVRPRALQGEPLPSPSGCLQMLPIRIGTRGSKLALAQAHEVRDRLAAAHGIEAAGFEIVVITTTGDRVRDRPLAEIGGKGLFTKEIEEALFEQRIDMAVHSMKDMPAALPAGLAIACLLPREDPRDAFLSPLAGDLTGLPHGARIGSSSVRRAAQVRRLRPDLEVVAFRGNVDTRLAKLAAGEVAATFLACAGLNRLGLSDRITSPVPIDIMLPAVAQGAVGIEIRNDDERTAGLIAAINDQATAVTVAAERAFLAALDGSCRTPLAGHAVLAEGRVKFRGQALSRDGSAVFETTRKGLADEAAALGKDAGQEIKAAAGSALFM